MSFTCPRRATELPDTPQDTDEWILVKGMPACSFCEGIEPRHALALLSAGQTLVTTGKPYKAYVGIHKIYYDHFNDAQRTEFLEMYLNGDVGLSNDKLKVAPCFAAHLDSELHEQEKIQGTLPVRTPVRRREIRDALADVRARWEEVRANLLEKRADLQAARDELQAEPPPSFTRRVTLRERIDRFRGQIDELQARLANLLVRINQYRAILQLEPQVETE